MLWEDKGKTFFPVLLEKQKNKLLRLIMGKEKISETLGVSQRTQGTFERQRVENMVSPAFYLEHVLTCPSRLRNYQYLIILGYFAVLCISATGKKKGLVQKESTIESNMFRSLEVETERKILTHSVMHNK